MTADKTPYRSLTILFVVSIVHYLLFLPRLLLNLKCLSYLNKFDVATSGEHLTSSPNILQVFNVDFQASLVVHTSW